MADDHEAPQGQPSRTVYSDWFPRREGQELVVDDLLDGHVVELLDDGPNGYLMFRLVSKRKPEDEER